MTQRTGCSATVSVAVVALFLVAALPGCVQRHCWCDDAEVNPAIPGHDGRSSAKVELPAAPEYDGGGATSRALCAEGRPEEKHP